MGKIIFCASTAFAAIISSNLGNICYGYHNRLSNIKCNLEVMVSQRTYSISVLLLRIFLQQVPFSLLFFLIPWFVTFRKKNIRWWMKIWWFYNSPSVVFRHSMVCCLARLRSFIFLVSAVFIF